MDGITTISFSYVSLWFYFHFLFFGGESKVFVCAYKTHMISQYL